MLGLKGSSCGLETGGGEESEHLLAGDAGSACIDEEYGMDGYVLGDLDGVPGDL